MSILIENIKQLITCKSNNGLPKCGINQSEIGLIENAFVLIEGENIKYAGERQGLERFLGNAGKNDITVIDAADKIVMPGFIDAHTHFVFAGSRENEYEMRLSGKSYQEIAEAGGGIAATVNEVRKSTKQKLINESEKRLKKFISYGTTTLEGKSGYGLDKENELKLLDVMEELNMKNKYGIDIIPTFLGAHSIPAGNSKEQYVNLIIEEMLPRVAERKLVRFIDIFIEENYFNTDDAERIFSAGKIYGLKPRIHTDQFTSMGGIDIAIRFNAASVDHLEVLQKKDIAKLSIYNKASARKISAVLLPGVSYFLGIPYQPAREIINGDIPVVLATDFNPGSSMTENIQTVMSLASLKLKMSAEEIINAVTINAAYSLDLENRLGSIESGKQADLLIFDMPSYKFLLYNYGVNNIEQVIKKGRLVYKAA
ncbi:MAG: Imidazolonepropionase [Ignavibacteria bacterium]|nr:Imidazolonepropionase [Ignavibacteria bacterium]